MTTVCLIVAVTFALKPQYVISDKWITAINSTLLETDIQNLSAVTTTLSGLKNNEDEVIGHVTEP